MQKLARTGLFFAGIVGIFVLLSLYTPHAQAQTPQGNEGAEITYPYYKKTERWVNTCSSESPVCNSNQSKRIEEKVGKSTRFSFLKKLATNLIPGSSLFTSANLKSSEKETTLYQPWYAKSYGITSCRREHTYTTFWGALSILKGKIGTSEGKTRSFCTGERGRDEGIELTDVPPDIETRSYRGALTTSIPSQGMTTEHAVKEDSRALLALTVPEAMTVAPTTMREVCKTFAKNLPKTCANTAVSTLVPGGMLITASGILEPITDAIQHLLFKDNPRWQVPLSVQAYSLVSTPSGAEERLVPCNAVRVAGKTLDANCGVTVSVSKKQLVRDVTPSTNVPYYRYELAVSGPAIKQASAPTRPLLGVISQSLGITQDDDAEEEGAVVFDQDGFLVIEGWDNEDLPIESPLASLIQELRERVRTLETSRNALKVQIEGIRKQRNYSPSPLLEQQSNAAPQPQPYAATPQQRAQLGNIMETLQSILGAMEEAVR